MISEDSKNYGRYGRNLTPLENAAHDKYDAVLDKYNAKGYDRLSVHHAIPEVAEAWEQIMAVSTFYELQGGVQEKDYNE